MHLRILELQELILLYMPSERLDGTADIIASVVSIGSSGALLLCKLARRGLMHQFGSLSSVAHGCVAQINVTLIALFNYYYTFLQLEPKDMADQLKRAGASIPAVRPGRATADYITKTLNRMSILGSAFLGALAATPPLVEAVTGLQVCCMHCGPRCLHGPVWVPYFAIQAGVCH